MALGEAPISKVDYRKTSVALVEALKGATSTTAPWSWPSAASRLGAARGGHDQAVA